MNYVFRKHKIIHTYLLAASNATACIYNKATVRLMFISIAQEIMRCQQKHKLYIAPCCLLLPVFSTRRLSKMCCIWSKYASEVLTSPCWGWFLNSNPESNVKRHKRGAPHGGMWGHGSPYRPRWAEHIAHVGGSVHSIPPSSVWWAQTASGT